MSGAGTTSAVISCQAPRLLRAGAAVLVLGTPVWLLALAVRPGSGQLVALDQQAVRAATAVTARSGLADVLVVLQTVSQPVVLYLLAAVVAVREWRVTGSCRRSAWAFATMMVSWVAGAGFKLLVARPRPVVESPLAHAAGYAFPSGHALNVTVAATTLLVLQWPRLTPRRRRAGVAIAMLAVVVVGLDRVFLGVHFPSDVLAGVVLGGCLVTASWFGFRGGGDDPLRPA
ncbi:hypothetical protein GCM10009616_33890 [Microlunatus lacustris]